MNYRISQVKNIYKYIFSVWLDHLFDMSFRESLKLIININGLEN